MTVLVMLEELATLFYQGIKEQVPVIGGLFR